MIDSITVTLLIAQIIVLITTPLVFFAILRFRKLTNYAPVLAGVAVYLVIFPLEAAVRGFVFAEEHDVAGVIKSNPLLNIIFSGLIALLFGELVRFVIFKFVLKESNRKHDALAFGAGFAIVEMLVRSFGGAFVPAMYAGLINEAGPEAFIQSVEDHEAAADVVTVMQAIQNSAIVLDIINGLLEIVAIIGLSMICFYAVKRKSYELIGIACVLEVIYNIPNALVSSGVIKSGSLITLMLLPFTLLIVYVAARFFKDYEKEAAYPDIKTFFGIGGRRLGK
ncbi:MAG: YhfC family intramembrane metalloprotease [Lachnospiraceae bacterium]|nr:YhfC family intramembrane metalloprotease [Lachnospiraceae bacterium]